MGKRRYISLETKLASALLRLGDVPYDDAKNMTAAQLISLYHFDHNIFHESGHPDVDKFWNIEPLLIKAHREKTKRDRKIIDKGRRIRAWNAAAPASTLRLGLGETAVSAHDAIAEASRPARPRRKLHSRGFDKRYRKKMDGTVVKR